MPSRYLCDWYHLYEMSDKHRFSTSKSFFFKEKLAIFQHLCNVCCGLLNEKTPGIWKLSQNLLNNTPITLLSPLAEMAN